MIQTPMLEKYLDARILPICDFHLINWKNIPTYITIIRHFIVDKVVCFFRPEFFQNSGRILESTAFLNIADGKDDSDSHPRKIFGRTDPNYMWFSSNKKILKKKLVFFTA